MKTCHPAIPVIVLVLLVVGCASPRSAWIEARRDDTASGYHRFLREHPDAPQTAEARERLELVRLRKHPTADKYEKFRASYPDSALLAEIRPEVEEPLFERARIRGTAAAYREFLEEFPDGRYAERAAGNLTYLENGGFGAQPAELAAFATRHGESDFAREAGRSVAAVDARRRGAIRSVGVVLEIAPGTPGGDRVARAIGERVRRHLRSAGVQLVALSGPEDPRGAAVGAILTVRHSEGMARPDVHGGSSFAGILAVTNVTLAPPRDGGVIWSEEFTVRAPTAERSDDRSVLFGPSGDRYWAEFYLPAVTWGTQYAVRAPYRLPAHAVAVASVGHRAVVLFAEGDFDVVDLSDPAAPMITGHYRRPQDLSKWSDLRIIGGSVVIFGSDGLEVVNISSGAPQRVLRLDRSRIGSVVAVEPVGSELLIAGSQGLLLANPRAGEPQVLIPRPMTSAATIGDRVLFTDRDSLYVASLAMLRKQKAEAQLPLGTGVDPTRLRTSGRTAVVIGASNVIVVDVSRPARPVVRSRFTVREAGPVADAVVSRGRLFLLGSRGLQVVDASGRRVHDSVDVEARARLAAAGRHLVMIGDGGLQVVDTTPFVSGESLAAPRP